MPHEDAEAPSAPHSSMPLQAAALPPVWLLGLCNAVLGITGAVAVLVVPQILSALHVPEPRIAEITTLALVPGFATFLIAPLLDLRFSKKTYSIGFTAASAVLALVSLLLVRQIEFLGWLLFAMMTCAMLAITANGSWLGSLVPESSNARLAAWLTAANVGGFGVTSMIGVSALRGLPEPFGALVLAALALAPLAISIFVPGRPPDPRLANETFRQFFVDIGRALSKPKVLLAAIMFASPAASFALTNMLGGVGRDYHASEAFVSIIGGLGVTVAGIVGSLLLPRLAKFARPPVLYLSIGALGSLFTLGLIALHRTPATFAAAMIGENVVQSAAFAVSNLVSIDAMGKHNPLAATVFGLLTAATGVPLAYMQFLDGHAYARNGLTSSFLTDGGLGLLACAGLALAVAWATWARRQPVLEGG